MYKNWRSTINERLIERNCREIKCFEELFESHSILNERVVQLALTNQRLLAENRSLHKENSDLSIRMKSQDQNQELYNEHKLFQMQEEITNALRDKGTYAAKVLELNEVIAQKEETIAKLRSLNDYLEKSEAELRNQLKRTADATENLENINKTLYDEQVANMLTSKGLEKKCRETEEINEILRQEVHRLQTKLDMKHNEEYDAMYKSQREAVKKEIEEAAATPIEVLSWQSNAPEHAAVSPMPSEVVSRLDAHEGEVHCVRFSPSSNFLATSGQDRKIKVWSTNSTGNTELRATLTGCNGAVLCVDFDPDEHYLLGCSTLDSACRIWSLSGFQLRCALTGHSNKVVAGRYVGDGVHIVTASADRTLKLWDVKNRACIKTMLAMSSCHDVVVCPSLSIIISGHFDKRLRMWDFRGDLNRDQIQLSGRISGLDINSDQNQLAACCKDDTLNLIDLRMNEVLFSLSSPQFKTSLDLVKPSFSPDGQFVAVGGNDGAVFVWNTRTGKCEKTLREHSTTQIVSVHWANAGGAQRMSSQFASCERTKRVNVWR